MTWKKTPKIKWLFSSAPAAAKLPCVFDSRSFSGRAKTAGLSVIISRGREKASLATYIIKKRARVFFVATFRRCNVSILWRFDAMEFWHHDVLTLRCFDAVALWRCGVSTVRRFDTVMFWHSDVLTSQRFNTMTFRRHGVSTLWRVTLSQISGKSYM